MIGLSVNINYLIIRDEKLKELQNWLRSLPSYSVERQPCGGSALEFEEVKEIEKIIDESTKTVSERKTNIQIKPNFLYRVNTYKIVKFMSD